MDTNEFVAGLLPRKESAEVPEVPDGGFLVAVEGIDGAGTTIQTQMLSDAMRRLDYLVVQTRQPSDGPVGRRIRDILRHEADDVSALAMAHLFAADRADHLAREVGPALAKRAVVVSDRWYHSSMAYQGAEIGVHRVVDINAGFRAPDITVFLDVDVETSLRRIRARGQSRDVYENGYVLQRASDAYREAFRQLWFTRRQHIVVLDGTDQPQQVAEEVMGVVLDRLRGGAPQFRTVRKVRPGGPGVAR